MKCNIKITIYFFVLLLCGCGGDGPSQSKVERLRSSGAAKNDTVILNGGRANYSITRNSSGYVVTDNLGSEAPKNIPLTGRLRFSDTSVAFDIDGVSGKAYRIYKAAFNRVPDPAGLGFWIAQMDNGIEINDVSSAFINSAEYNSAYPKNLSNSDIISKYYQNVLGRLPDAGGMAFWISVLNSGSAKLSEILSSFSESPENKAGVSALTNDGITYFELGVNYGPIIAQNPIAKIISSASIAKNTTIILDGSSSTVASGQKMIFSWQLISKPLGSSAVLSSPNTVKPTFFADYEGIYVVTLTISNGIEVSKVASLSMTAAIQNVAPTAVAGVAIKAKTGSQVMLNGSESFDPNGDQISYKWVLSSKPTGSAASLTSTTSVTPSFTPDVDGNYVVTLIVNDGALSSTASTVTVTASQVKELNIEYVARNGMTVKLNSFTTTDNGNGYVTYDLTYTQSNNTKVAIDEAQFKLYFQNSAAMPQYGGFNKVYPGQNFSLTRSYSWTQLKTSVPTILEYDADNFFSTSPNANSLQWVVPGLK